MSKQVYISADYANDNGDREVVDTLNRWGQDSFHRVDFIDMSRVASGSVSESPDCRICDLKDEFNRQINASSAVIFIVGDKTAVRTAGSECNRNLNEQYKCWCTPYKQNVNGQKLCRVATTVPALPDGDCGCINGYSYLKHEFMQAKKKSKPIIILYNSLRNEKEWLPSYMDGYEELAMPFWKYDSIGRRVGNYDYIKGVLGF